MIKFDLSNPNLRLTDGLIDEIQESFEDYLYSRFGD